MPLTAVTYRRHCVYNKQAMNNAPIGIFDSGFGGLTVARAIREQLPQESLIYFGDTARCPYGPRPIAEVQGYVRQICSWLVEQGVKMIVIACNTATAAGLHLAQQEFDVPIIGVVEPGARAAARRTINRKVGVIATQGTVNSGAYRDAICARDAGIEVTSIATPLFVDIVEEGLRKEGESLGSATFSEVELALPDNFDEVAHAYLDPFIETQIDTLVLGCTHFPLISPRIREIMGESVAVISSAGETAKDVARTLEYRGHLCTEGHKPVYSFATTGADLAEFSEIGSRILGAPLENPVHLDL